MSENGRSLLVTNPTPGGKMTKLDKITHKIYSPAVIKFLNQPIIDIQPPINIWSLTHLFWGVVFYLSGISFVWALIVHTIFEIWEIYMAEMKCLSAEDILDTIFDTLFFLSPYLIFPLLNIKPIFPRNKEQR